MQLDLQGSDASVHVAHLPRHVLAGRLDLVELLLDALALRGVDCRPGLGLRHA